MNTHTDLTDQLLAAHEALENAADLMPEGDRFEADRQELLTLLRRLGDLGGRLAEAGQA